MKTDSENTNVSAQCTLGNPSTEAIIRQARKARQDRQAEIASLDRRIRQIDAELAVLLAIVFSPLTFMVCMILNLAMQTALNAMLDSTPATTSLNISVAIVFSVCCTAITIHDAMSAAHDTPEEREPQP